MTDSATTGSPSDADRLHGCSRPPLAGPPPASLRRLPQLIPDSEFFWTAGGDGVSGFSGAMGARSSCIPLNRSVRAAQAALCPRRQFQAMASSTPSR